MGREKKVETRKRRKISEKRTGTCNFLRLGSRGEEG
nr:MAG TPA: hypothetical protein [Caudoviricetes sp.]